VYQHEEGGHIILTVSDTLQAIAGDLTSIIMGNLPGLYLLHLKYMNHFSLIFVVFQGKTNVSMIIIFRSYFIGTIKINFSTFNIIIIDANIILFLFIIMWYIMIIIIIIIVG